MHPLNRINPHKSLEGMESIVTMNLLKWIYGVGQFDDNQVLLVENI